MVDIENIFKGGEVVGMTDGQFKHLKRLELRSLEEILKFLELDKVDESKDKLKILIDDVQKTLQD